MGYDPRYDAFGALALGGVGALGGLGYSLLRKKQRNNKLRNALIGAAALPSAYIGGKYLASKFMDDADHYLLWQRDPLFNYVSSPIYRSIHKQLPNQDNIDFIDKEHETDIALDKFWANYEKEYPYSERPPFYAVDKNILPDQLKMLYDDVNRLGNEEWELYKKKNATDDKNYEIAANIEAGLGYGTLGTGITVPALIAYMRRRKRVKKEQDMA